MAPGSWMARYAVEPEPLRRPQDISCSLALHQPENPVNYCLFLRIQGACRAFGVERGAIWPLYLPFGKFDLSGFVEDIVHNAVAALSVK